MQLGFVGLGKMGLNMVTRLTRAGHAIVAYDLDAGARARATAAGVISVDRLDALVDALAVPRAVWVMVPAGEPTESPPATSSSTAATRTSPTITGERRRLRPAASDTSMPAPAAASGGSPRGTA
jgi:3-hydroxyisobutyrate dehydrogenase-like beta-hydroxyacid dehydrogenase